MPYLSAICPFSHTERGAEYVVLYFELFRCTLRAFHTKGSQPLNSIRYAQPSHGPLQSPKYTFSFSFCRHSSSLIDSDPTLVSMPRQIPLSCLQRPWGSSRRDKLRFLCCVRVWPKLLTDCCVCYLNRSLYHWIGTLVVQSQER